MDPRTAKELIDSTQGKFFSVIFTKRSGGIREMVARTGVKKGVKGIGLKYNPADYSLVSVFDVNNGFRMIPLDGIHQIKFKGSTYT